MTRADVKAELESSLGSMLSERREGVVTQTSDIGRFVCSVEKIPDITMVRRDFETDDSLNIPFAEEKPSMQMIFSFDGQSVFNDRSNPFILNPTNHCVNFFNRYECRNLLQKGSRQHDLSFRLDPGFYAGFVSQYISSNDRLAMLVLNGTNFNTINHSIPADLAVTGILRNILGCPYKGEMKTTFIREHIRALLTLQFFYFNTVLTGGHQNSDRRITSRDRDVLCDIKTFIDQNFLHPTSIEGLSKHFGLNEFKIKHGFKSMFDTSPIRYLQLKRLEFALALLRETDKTIKEIADEVGYSHAANFSAAIIRTFGHPPVHFRKGVK